MIWNQIVVMNSCSSIEIVRLPQSEVRVRRFHFHYKFEDQHNRISSNIHNQCHLQRVQHFRDRHSSYFLIQNRIDEMMIWIQIVAMNCDFHFRSCFVIEILSLPQNEVRVHRFHIHYKSEDQHNRTSSHIHNPFRRQKSSVSISSREPSIWEPLLVPSCTLPQHYKLEVLCSPCSWNMVYCHTLHLHSIRCLHPLVQSCIHPLHCKLEVLCSRFIAINFSVMISFIRCNHSQRFQIHEVSFQ